MTSHAPEPIYLESGKARTFACAVDWPGWCRVARGDDAAIATLEGYRPRYAMVAQEAGVAFPSATDVSPDERFVVVERVPGSGTTDFGAPGAVPDADRRLLDADTAHRVADLVAAPGGQAAMRAAVIEVLRAAGKAHR